MATIDSKSACARGALAILCGSWLIAGGLTVRAQTAPAPAPEVAPAPPQVKLAADAAAFKAARALTDPAAKVAALRKAIADYPDSKLVPGAHYTLLATLTKSLPERATEIRDEARYLVKHSKRGSERQSAENNAASSLAMAGPSGVDLEDAEQWAADAVKKDTEPSHDKETIAAYTRYKEPVPSAAELHRIYGADHANVLQTLGEVYLAEGKLEALKQTVAEGFALNPADGGLMWLRAELEARDHQDAAALSDFETASFYGRLPARESAREMELYRALHGGSEAGFEAELDARYRARFPASKSTARAANAAGHTVLLELFTGSGCHPCTAMDVAVDEVLDVYPRSTVVVLAWDLHIPRPDPLANRDSVARAKSYGINSTPTYGLDGHMFPSDGGDREESEKFVKAIERNLDPQASRPASVKLVLVPSAGDAGTVAARAQISTGPAEAIDREIAAVPVDVPDPAAKTDPVPKAAAKTALQAFPPKLKVHFALVEDEVRYSGENGVRFHRMLVRAEAPIPVGGNGVTVSGEATVDAKFDLAAVRKGLDEYLDAFAKENDRFGNVEWISRDTRMDPAHLGIVAWVEDSVSHRVLGAAYTPAAMALAAR